jgi:hypothetical protein
MNPNRIAVVSVRGRTGRDRRHRHCAHRSSGCGDCAGPDRVQRPLDYDHGRDCDGGPGLGWALVAGVALPGSQR